MKTKLFAYGTLNVHSIQRAVWGEAKEGKCGHIYDHELKIYSNNIFYLERKPGESVAGKVYELTEEELKATDKYETDAYERVTIRGENGNATVDTYIRRREALTEAQ